MARLGGMSTESFSSARDRAISAASIGLAAILRDQKTIPGSNRSTVFLGLSAQAPSSAASRSLSNSAMCSLANSPTESSSFLDAGDDPDDHKEDDISADSRNPASLKDHKGLISDGASSHGSDVRNHGNDSAFRHGFPHAHSHTATLSYNQQRNSCVMHHEGSKQQIYTADASRFARQHIIDKSVGIRDITITFSKGSDSQSSHASSGRASTPSWTVPYPGRRTSDDATDCSELQSAPVNVPNWPRMIAREGNGAVCGCNIGTTVVEEDDSERLPPHEILAREYAQRQTMTSSVCEGQGRTLKGRDMRRVRNAVWRRSGFAD